MTCIVGLAEDGVVYMGGDSAACAGWDIRQVKHPKVFKVGPFVVGYTDSFRMGQLLQYHLKIPARPLAEGTYQYMVKTFGDEARGMLKEHGYSRVEANQEEGGSFLVGYEGRLYLVTAEFAVLEYQGDFDAVGCGADFAKAVLAVTEGLPPEERVYKALETAARFSGGVVEPFHIVTGARRSSR